MDENSEDNQPVQSEENAEELKEDSGAVEEDVEPEARAVANSVQGSEENPRKRRKPESKEPITPLLDRPSRERKSIDRFIDSVEMEKEKPKELKIEQGSGTYLRDIPNVVFKFSKRKWSDETVQFLHKLLYNRRAKPQQVKINILQFSGWVWGANEEKEKSKLKEKLEKCFKESLWQICDIFDLNLPKTTRKEDMVSKVFEFLDCPYKTTDRLLEEQEQKSKDKKRQKPAAKGKRKSSGQTPSKKQKRGGKSSNGGLEEEDEGEEEEQAEEEPEEELEGDEDPEEEPVEVQPEKKLPKKPRSAKKGGRRSAKKSGDPEKVEVEPDVEDEDAEPKEVDNNTEDDDDEEPKRKRSKKKKIDDDVSSVSPKRSGRKPAKKKSINEPPQEEEAMEDATDRKDAESKPVSKGFKTQVSKEAKASHGKKQQQKKEEPAADAQQETQKKARGKRWQEPIKEESRPTPTDDDLRAAICELLREADFSTVTFTDVVKQLGAKFDVDLSQKKAHVKVLIQEEISKLVDEDEGEDGEGEDEDNGADEPDKVEPDPVASTAQD